MKSLIALLLALISSLALCSSEYGVVKQAFMDTLEYTAPYPMGSPVSVGYLHAYPDQFNYMMVVFENGTEYVITDMKKDFSVEYKRTISYNPYHCNSNGDSSNQFCGGNSGVLFVAGGNFIGTAEPKGISSSSNGMGILFAEGNQIKMVSLGSGYTVSVIAGNGTEGDSGDGGTAIDAQLNGPEYVTSVREGSGVWSYFIFFSDTGNHKIKAIDTDTGFIYTIAGTGTAGDGPEDGPGTSCALNSPKGIVIDSENGVVYFADSGNHKVRRVDFRQSIITETIIGTVAGTGIKGIGGSGVASTINIDTPADLAIIDGTIYFTEGGRIRNLTEPECPDGTIVMGNTKRCYIGCYGIAMVQSNVCSGFGNCTAADTCVCQPGYAGSKCDVWTCFGKSNTDPTVCSGMNSGSCVGSDFCQCFPNSFGQQCEHTSCNGIPNNDTNVCNGHGSCTSFDQCTCNAGWAGQYCDQPGCHGKLATDAYVCSGISHGTCLENGDCQCVSGYGGEECFQVIVPNECFGILESNPLVCSGNGICVSTNNCSCFSGFSGDICATPISHQNETFTTPKNSTTCFGIDESNTNVCSGRGRCIGKDLCDCFGNFEKGYWYGQVCDICQPTYSGESCLTKFSQAHFNPEGNLIELFVEAPPTYTSMSVDCSKLLESTLELGIGVSCFWVNRENGLFNLLLGDSPTIFPNFILQFNTRVFDVSVTLPIYQPVYILASNSSIPPVARIDTRRKLFGSCENITIDGSRSYTGDGRGLVYSWTIISGPLSSSVESYLAATPKITIPYYLMNAGIFQIQLSVTSVFTNLTNTFSYTFTKAAYDVPLVEIVGGNVVFTKLKMVPLFVKKAVYESCFSSDTVITFNWTQTTGSNVNYLTDNNGDLVILDFSSTVNQVVRFRLDILFDSKITSQDLTVDASLQDISSDIFVINQGVDYVQIDSEVVDPDDLTDEIIYKWSCLDVTNKDSCTNFSSQLTTINSQNLKMIQLTTYTTIISTLQMTLNVTKGSRFAVSTTLVTLVPKSTPLPPIISKLNIIPSTPRINKGDLLSVQLDVAPRDCVLEWKMNSNPVPNRLTTQMASLNSPSLIIDTSGLTEGGSYTFSLQATHPTSSAVSTYDYSVHINIAPSCTCSFSPETGFALDTDFKYDCYNCRNVEDTILNFGFYDEITGAQIPLSVNGEKFSSKLPAPSSGNVVTVYSEVVNAQTGSKFTKTQNVTVEFVKMTKLTDVESKYSEWILLGKSQPKNLAALIYYSAAVSKTVSVMKNFISSLSSGQSDSCNGRGTFNSKTKVCDCQTGFFKKDCSVDKTTFDEYVKINDELATNIVESWDQRNKIEKLSLSYFSLNLFGIASYMANFDELSSATFKKTLGLMGDILKGDIMKSSPQVESLLLLIIQFLYSSIRTRKSSVRSLLENSDLQDLQDLMSQVSSLRTKNRVEGMPALITTSEFSSTITNKIWGKDYSALKVDLPTNPNLQTGNGGSSVLFPSKISVHQTSRKTPVAFSMTTQLNSVWESTIALSTSRNITSDDKYIQERNSTTIFSEFTLQSMIDNELTNMSDPIEFKLSLSRAINQMEFEKFVTEETISTNGLNHKVANTYRSYACSIRKGKEWDTSSCHLQISFGAKHATCRCQSLGTIMISEFSIQQYSDFTMITNSTQPVGETCSWCIYLATLSVIPLAIILLMAMGIVVPLVKKVKRWRKVGVQHVQVEPLEHPPQLVIGHLEP